MIGSAFADTLIGSSALQFESFEGRGGDDLLERIRDCWASAYGQRVIAYRKSQGLCEEPTIAVVVQKMVNSRAAGVMFTINPVTGDRAEIVIEGNYGLGETVVSGAVNPDDFVVNKETLKITSRRIAKKTLQYLRDPKTGMILRRVPDVGEEVWIWVVATDNVGVTQVEFYAGASLIG